MLSQLLRYKEPEMQSVPARVPKKAEKPTQFNLKAKLFEKKSHTQPLLTFGNQLPWVQWYCTPPNLTDSSSLPQKIRMFSSQ